MPAVTEGSKVYLTPNEAELLSALRHVVNTALRLDIALGRRENPQDLRELLKRECAEACITISKFFEAWPRDEIGRTLADKVSVANNWPFAMACGYLDGQRDRDAGVASAIPELEMTEYAHGYFRGYKSAS